MPIAADSATMDVRMIKRLYNLTVSVTAAPAVWTFLRWRGHVAC
jgi:hypothetical protein